MQTLAMAAADGCRLISADTFNRKRKEQGRALLRARTNLHASADGGQAFPHVGQADTPRGSLHVEANAVIADAQLQFVRSSVRVANC